MDTNTFGINELISSIEVDGNLPIRTPKEILGEEDYTVIKDTFDIMAKYKKSDWMADIPEVEMQADIVSLQVTLVTLAEKFCLMSTYQDAEADRLKIARSKVRLSLKQQKANAEASGKQVKITADDIKDASLALTEQLSQKYEDAQVAANFLKFVYYSVRDAVSLLDRALGRIYKFTPESETRQRMY
jgi:hypothetical protein